MQTGRKHCGKRRNCSLRTISPFPIGFSKDWYCRHVKTRASLEKDYRISPNKHSRSYAKHRLGAYVLYPICKAKSLSNFVYHCVLEMFNPFRNKPWFLCVCSTTLLKTQWEKEKLLITSNFSFSHSVF